MLFFVDAVGTHRSSDSMFIIDRNISAVPINFLRSAPDRCGAVFTGTPIVSFLSSNLTSVLKTRAKNTLPDFQCQRKIQRSQVLPSGSCTETPTIPLRLVLIFQTLVPFKTWRASKHSSVSDHNNTVVCNVALDSQELPFCSKLFLQHIWN